MYLVIIGEARQLGHDREGVLNSGAWQTILSQSGILVARQKSRSLNYSRGASIPGDGSLLLRLLAVSDDLAKRQAGGSIYARKEHFS